MGNKPIIDEILELILVCGPGLTKVYPYGKRAETWLDNHGCSAESFQSYLQIPQLQQYPVWKVLIDLQCSDTLAKGVVQANLLRARPLDLVHSVNVIVDLDEQELFLRNNCEEKHKKG